MPPDRSAESSPRAPSRRHTAPRAGAAAPWSFETIGSTERGLVLVVVDRAGLAHAPQHVCAPRRRALGLATGFRIVGRCGMPARIATSEIGEVAELLTEVRARGGRDAVRPLAEEIRVQVELEDLLLRELALDAGTRE